MPAPRTAKPYPDMKRAATRGRPDHSKGLAFVIITHEAVEDAHTPARAPARLARIVLHADDRVIDSRYQMRLSPLFIIDYRAEYHVLIRDEYAAVRADSNGGGVAIAELKIIIFVGDSIGETGARLHGADRVARLFFG